MSAHTTCKRCDGTGVEPLSPAYERTLALFRCGKPGVFAISAAGVALGDGCSPTAANNRLEHLRARGLIVREKQGRQWFYRLAMGRRG